MDPLSVAGSIAGLVTLADAVFRGVYKYYKTVSDASKEIQNLASQLQSFAGILHSLVLLAGALEQHGTHTTLQMTHISDATTLLGEIQGRLNKSMSKNNSTKLSNIQRSLKWPFTKTHTKELSNALAQQQQIISLALEADSLSSLIELLGNSEDMKKKISSIQVGVENLQVLTRVEINAERKRILDSFLKVNPQPNLDTSRKLRHPGTGTWLTESLQFQQWIETAGSKMWLTGIPGAGKTVLAGAVIQKALDKGKNSPQVGVAFFFCDYKDEKATVSSNILGAIVSQLGRQSNQAFDEVKKLYESLHPPNGLTRDLDSDFLQDCLEKIFKHFEQIILVVDGLDECGDNTDETIEWLVNVADYSTNVTMALASRDEYKIDLKLRDSFTKIPVSARREDIILYVASEIDRRVRDGRLRINDMSIKDDILTKLSHDADGMFRWVTCQLDYICGCPTDADRRVALKELPPTLDATYDRMLRRIHRGHPRARHIVQKCLQLLAIKGFRWHIRALCCAISVPDTINVTLDEGSIVTEVEVLIQCSSFIRKSEDAKYFEFSHFTVREFLERDRLLKDHELASYHLSVPISHAALCQQSLRYLLLRNFYHMSELDKSGLGQYLRKIQEDPFYVSATIDWIFALRYTPQEPCCLELAKCLFNPHKSPSFISWAIQICARLLELAPDSSVQASSSHLLRAASMVLDPEFRPIHLAAALDMPEICEYLIDVDTKWNTVSMIGSPLECSIGGPFCLIGSCPEGLKDLDEISDVVALAYATHRPGQVTSMLKEAGCVMQDSPCQLGQWSLMEVAILSAVASLDFSPVTNLVSMRWVISETEAVAFEKNMALLLRGYPYSYVPGNHTQLIASFLQLITTLNSFRAYDSEGGFKMCVAAWNTAVKLECDFIEDVHLIDTRISLSLDALIHKCGVAISNDDVELMQRYLGDIRITGPEISDDGADGCGYSLLRRAITKNSVKVVRLLSERGYSLKSPFWDGLLPIHEAWSCGEDMIRLLFEFGASQFEVDSRGNNIWHLAASRFKYNTLSALRKSTAEERLRALHMQNKEGFTPLTLAIYEMGSLSEDGSDGREDAAATLQFLLDACGCDTLCWQCAMSPWHLVARSGSVIAIKQLKKSGVTPDTIQEGQCTPLHALNSMASKECVELLRAAFPTADSIQHQNRTPLQHFIYNCFIQRIDPPLGVIESLADTTTSTTQTHCALWDYFCKGILGSTTLSVEYPHTSLDTIFQDILGIRAIEAYEEVKCESAIIPLFSSMDSGHRHALLQKQLSKSRISS
ncbi:hypothetical protein F5B22DRAFT_638390 [Xylaria bambusicola]|uniref:uncharacterized protein n=1 Tax=Xylaria bambusicola TaxID=326684 RepID=UPI0020078E92|nr:uncharacterized protein F5B22DRAFT_638390 [Xylaria bambusicola]KAI0509026.1 hypothetical protein F5B22DRAFT_638390 [Xylaria bambusicola]